MLRRTGLALALAASLALAACGNVVTPTGAGGASSTTGPASTGVTTSTTTSTGVTTSTTTSTTVTTSATSSTGGGGGAGGAAASCFDGVKNGGETDVDCGGPCPPCKPPCGCVSDADCPPGAFCQECACWPPACKDGVKNGTETDVDCGGPGCPKCGPGSICLAGTDFTSGVCTAGVCQG